MASVFIRFRKTCEEIVYSNDAIVHNFNGRRWWKDQIRNKNQLNCIELLVSSRRGAVKIGMIRSNTKMKDATKHGEEEEIRGERASKAFVSLHSSQHCLSFYVARICRLYPLQGHV